MNDAELEASHSAFSQNSRRQSSWVNYSRPVSCLFFILFMSIKSIMPIISVLSSILKYRHTSRWAEDNFFSWAFILLIFRDGKAQTGKDMVFFLFI